MRRPPAACVVAIALTCIAATGPCRAEGPRGPGTGDAGGAGQGASPTAPPDAHRGPEEIVVTARRRSEADIASETELQGAEIDAYGAASIGELVGAIAPLIDGDGEAPALLVNGKRIGSPAEITDYPPEALDRVAILPREAAARYGYPAGRRVVNLELKPKYASWDVDAGLTVPTAGGRRSVQTAAGRTAISGDTRWNVQVTLADDSALLKSARRLPVRNDLLALLPALEEGEGVDPNRFESVIGGARSAGLNAGVSRPLGAFAVALNVNATLNRSRQLTGLPIGSVILPPAAGGGTISRLLGDEALSSRQTTRSLGASATISGTLAGWQTTLSVLYSSSNSRNIYDRGFDVSAVQQRIDAGDPDFDPEGPWPATPLLSDRSRFRTATVSATFSASKAVAELPAGPLSASLTASAARTGSYFLSKNADGIQRDRPRSTQIDGRLSFTIPVASRARDVLPLLGELGLDLSAEAGTATGTRTRRKWTALLRWGPARFLDLRAGLDHENVEPSFDQLRGPRIEVVTRLFDFARQEYVQPVRIFGGNPDLSGGRMRTLTLGATVRPFAGDLLTASVSYRRQVARGAILPFPTLSPDIEAAFPDRVTRNADGRLLVIDARPVNALGDRNAALSSGLTLRKMQSPPVSAAAAAFRPWTVSLSVNHNWQLGAVTVVRPNLPAIDRLRDSGRPRHTAAFSLVVGRSGMGASLTGNWVGGASVRNGDTLFRYAASALFNLGLFVEPEQWVGAPDERGWASALRLSLDVQNLFGGYRKVSVSGGVAPAGFTRDEIDPLGRTVRLSIRKQF